MIHTERLVLRPPVQNDLEPLHAIFGDRDAMRYWSHETHTDIAQTQKTLDAMMSSFKETGLELVIEHDGQVIGKAGLWRLAELGYILRPDHWGKGFAKEALSAVIDAAWVTHPDLRGITAEIDPLNIGSERLLEKLGFSITGTAKETLHVYGEWCDSVYYTLPRPEG